MEVEYTKGKWERKGNVISVFGKGTIAKLPNTLDGGVMEFIANSHLVEASPLLYEAIKMYQAHSKNTRGHYCSECADALSRALSKVEGL